MSRSPASDGGEGFLLRRLHEADAARPLPPARLFTVADLERGLHRRRVRRAVLGSVLVATAALWFLWLGRPAVAGGATAPALAPEVAARLRAEIEALQRSWAATWENHDVGRSVDPFDIDRLTRDADLAIERAAMTSRCFAEALRPIDPEAARDQEQRLLVLFPDTVAVTGLTPHRPGENR